jgi:hypothetical protein
MPALWPWARSAEIEGLHVAAVGAAALLLIDRAVLGPTPGGNSGRTSLRSEFLPGMVIGGLFVAAGLLKGPAGLPALGGAMIAACVITRSLRPLLAPSLWIGILLAGPALVWVARAMYAAADDTAITQGVAEFLWSRDRIGTIALLAPAALVAGLPATLAILFPWGADASCESQAPRAARELHKARALACAYLCGLAICVVAGVSNVRYTLPLLQFLPPLCAYAVRGAVQPGTFTAVRRRIARIITLGHPAIMLGALVLLAAVWVPLQEQVRRRNSGKAAGGALGQAVLEDASRSAMRADIWADDAIDARPEVLHYLRRISGSTVRWKHADLEAGRLPPDGRLLVLRTDDGSGEKMRFAAQIASGELTPLAKASAHKFEFALYRVCKPAK